MACPRTTRLRAHYTRCARCTHCTGNHTVARSTHAAHAAHTDYNSQVRKGLQSECLTASHTVHTERILVWPAARRALWHVQQCHANISAPWHGGHRNLEHTASTTLVWLAAPRQRQCLPVCCGCGHPSSSLSLSSSLLCSPWCALYTVGRMCMSGCQDGRASGPL
eukprot:1157383-Pelagomonas_calceolata.AAC.3